MSGTPSPPSASSRSAIFLPRCLAQAAVFVNTRWPEGPSLLPSTDQWHQEQGCHHLCLWIQTPGPKLPESVLQWCYFWKTSPRWISPDSLLETTPPGCSQRGSSPPSVNPWSSVDTQYSKFLVFFILLLYRTWLKTWECISLPNIHNKQVPR